MDVFGHITDKCTPSRPLGGVKLSRAWLVVRWVTTCEAQVLKAIIWFLNSSTSFHGLSGYFFLVIINNEIGSIACCVCSRFIDVVVVIACMEALVLLFPNCAQLKHIRCSGWRCLLCMELYECEYGPSNCILLSL